MNGLLNVLKVPGMTSHDVVSQVRGLFTGVKVGHGGTLDPSAAGVLPLMLGKATRLSEWVMGGTKKYRAEMLLGITTDTDDLSGTVMNRNMPPAVSENALKALLRDFEGELVQVPPLFSAVKHRGRKMYQYAREGKEIDRKERTVMIHSINLINFLPPDRVLFEVCCSKGTYIRTLCRQIGEALGSGACMSFLLRTRVGYFYLSDAAPVDEIEKNPEDFVLPMDFVFQDKKKLTLEEVECRSLCYGQKISIDRIRKSKRIPYPLPVDEKIVPVYTTEGEFVALARWETLVHGDGLATHQLVPERVFKTVLQG